MLSIDWAKYTYIYIYVYIYICVYKYIHIYVFFMSIKTIYISNTESYFEHITNNSPVTIEANNDKNLNSLADKTWFLIVMETKYVALETGSIAMVPADL